MVCIKAYRSVQDSKMCSHLAGDNTNKTLQTANYTSTIALEWFVLKPTGS